MITSSQLPSDPGIRYVRSLEELLEAPLEHEAWALCWPRVLGGNFAAVVDLLEVPVGITPLEEEALESLPAGAAARQAIATMLEDQRTLRACGIDVELNCVNGYLPAAEPDPMRTDVCSFHVDSADIETSTFLCTYHGASSEGLHPEQARRRVDDPATRAALLAAYGGPEGDGFEEYLSDYCYDLHYSPTPGARPFSFGVGHLWRIAVQWPGAEVPACVHRAPDPIPGEKRLLLIG